MGTEHWPRQAEFDGLLSLDEKRMLEGWLKDEATPPYLESLRAVNKRLRPRQRARKQGTVVIIFAVLGMIVLMSFLLWKAFA
jgi:hypothetical protein